MTEAIVVAVITASASVIAQYLIGRRTNDLMQYRLGELEKKVMKHNNFSDRLVVCENSIEHMQEEIKEIKGAVY